MDGSIYKLKRYVHPSNYIDFTEDLITKNIIELKHIKFELPEINTTITVGSKQLKLPDKSYQNLKNLLEYFYLKAFEEEFLSFVSISQSTYLTYNKKFEGELEECFLKERKGLEKLLKVLELYLFGSKKKLHSISFKFKREPTQTINNLFVLDDIFNVILSSYKLTEDNFCARKKDILNNTNIFNFKKGGQYIIMKITQNLFTFLKKYANGISDNEALRFCGVLLHICQIPSNKKSDDITVENIEDSLKLIDHQNLMHLKNGRLKHFMA